MKKIFISVVTLVVFSFFISCFSFRVPVSRTVPANNSTYEVEYLFEHDGCKVYRFYDYGNRIYFTNCDGSVTGIVNDSIQTRVINLNNKVK